MNQFLKSIRKKRRVLAVDDELINRELIEAILALNYDVTGASNGKEAMEMLYSAKEPYSLILLDLLMPQMSGFQVLEACKADEKLRDIPIIVMTSEKSAEVRSIRMGADDFITKPYRMPEVILARCERIIELSEEKQLIRSVELDHETGLYIKQFFEAYINRVLSDLRGEMDAIAVKVVGAADNGQAIKEAARLTRDLLAGRRGIACRAKDDLFYVFCAHRMNYDEILCDMEDRLVMSCGRDVSLKAGICEKVDKTQPIDSWYEKAKAACDGIQGEIRTAIYTE
ncbi:MAG: response regulator [Ruminococcus sp.]|nr:response regulator [Ruminococcus sp.]